MNRLTNVVQTTNGTTAASAGYQYDSAGRLWKKTYGNNDIVTHGYDMESRLLSLAISNSTALVTRYNYQWDAGGSILAITNNGTNVTLYGYDRVGQLTNAVAFTNGLAGSVTNAWQYDDAGNWTKSPGENLWRMYNSDNEMAGVSPNSTNAVTVTGQVQAGPNSNKWYHTTAECKGVSALVNTNNGTFSLPNVPLEPGTNALVVTVTDVSGNSTQQVRHVTKSALETFRYDGNGNLTNWLSGTTNWVYEWDWADRLTKVSSNSVVLLQNWYDASGRRMAKSELVNGQTQKWLYLYDGWNIIGVMNTNGVILETYTRGVGLAGDIGTLVAVTHHAGSTTNGTFYTHANHRGDVVLTRSGTTTTGAYEYSAFGTLKTQTGTDVCRFKFSSKERDAFTGFNYYGARFYAPQWQRWPNRDPIEEEGGINLYNYVGNDTINWIDLFGLQSSETPAGIQIQLEFEANELGIPVKQLIERKAAEKLAEQAAKKAAQEVADKLAARCTSKIGKIANKFGKSKKEIKDAIHAAKNKMKVSGNPDVSVDLQTGEIHPITSNGSLGDSIGNINY